MMRWLTLPLLLGCFCASASSVVSVSRSGNSVQFRLDDGAAEILWMSPSTIRVRQAWRDRAAVRPAPKVEKLDFSLFEAEDSVRLRSRDVAVLVTKRPFAIRFESVDGSTLVEQVDARLDATGKVDYHFRLQPDERLYGLGHQSPQLNRRGAIITTTRPLLVSSEGYGLYFPGARSFQFDAGATQPSLLGITAASAQHGDYVVYLSGAPAQILEQHSEWFGEAIEPLRAHAGTLPPSEKPSYALLVEGAWQEVLRQIFQAGFSGIPVAAVNPSFVRDFQTPFGGDLLAAIPPVLLVDSGGRLSPQAAALRRSFESHRLTYLMEARDRGLPPIHSMAHQFPFDDEASRIEDQFFFGDEILVAPMLGSSNRRLVYLPQGVWTDWHSNRVHRGRQTIAIKVNRNTLPMFARNGSIVPVDRPDRIELHYFPKLGGEYFLWEPETDQITQIHAGPAGDFLRLQIEEKAGRRYEWIVHNVVRPTEVRQAGRILQSAPVSQALQPRQWRYDESRKNLHIGLHVRAGEDQIVNVAFRAGAWSLQ